MKRLIFSARNFNASAVLNTVESLGFVVNTKKSITEPVQTMIYLGLHTDTLSRTIRPTQACLQHMAELLAIVPKASRQDLLRIRGYVAWIAFAMRWPHSSHNDLQFGWRYSASVESFNSPESCSNHLGQDYSTQTQHPRP
jgi:hypothetical protein